VRSMLGTVDREHVYRIADALVAGDGAALLVEADALTARGLSASAALEELASLFHRIAIVQTVPAGAANFDDAARLRVYAERFSPETVQLAYQICAQGRADLAIAPDESIGFAMTLLRLHAFEPATGTMGAESAPASAALPASRPSRPASNLGSVRAAQPAPQRDDDARSDAAPRAEVAAKTSPAVALPADPSAWPAFVSGLKLTGLASQLAAQSELRSVEGNVVNLGLPATHKHLADRAYSDKLKGALEQATGRKLMLAFEVGEATPASLAAKERRERDQVRERTEAAFRDEPFVRDIVERFDGSVRPDSIKPLG